MCSGARTCHRPHRWITGTSRTTSAGTSIVCRRRARRAEPSWSTGRASPGSLTDTITDWPLRRPMPSGMTCRACADATPVRALASLDPRDRLQKRPVQRPVLADTSRRREAEFGCNVRSRASAGECLAAHALVSNAMFWARAWERSFMGPIRGFVSQVVRKIANSIAHACHHPFGRTCAQIRPLARVLTPRPRFAFLRTVFKRTS